MMPAERKAKAAAHNRRYYAADPEKFRERSRHYSTAHPKSPSRVREIHLKHKFRLTVADYNDLLEQQNFQCAACGTDLRVLPTKQVVVDHDHMTMLVRGILCHGCNLILGHAKEDPIRLQALAAYAEKFNP